jgi:hypothetical protein
MRISDSHRGKWEPTVDHAGLLHRLLFSRIPQQHSGPDGEGAVCNPLAVPLLDGVKGQQVTCGLLSQENI